MNRNPLTKLSTINKIVKGGKLPNSALELSSPTCKMGNSCTGNDVNYIVKLIIINTVHAFLIMLINKF